MGVRREIRRAVRQLLKANAAGDRDRVNRIVVRNYHVLPAQVIARVFGLLSVTTLSTLAAYIPRSMYAKIPAHCVMHEQLRPLVYMQPASQIWDLQELAAMTDCELHTLYAKWDAIRRNVDWLIDGLLDGRVAAAYVLPHASLKHIHEIFEAAKSSARLQQSLMSHIGDLTLRAVPPRIVLPLLEANVGMIDWWLLRDYIAESAGHYKIVRYIMRACIAHRARPYYVVLRGLLAGNLFLRLPSDLKIWTITYAMQQRHALPQRALSRICAPPYLTPRELATVRKHQLCNNITTYL